ncbi:MAG: MgtC/SapB family protein [Lachnospiraceae bacterium]|nr:MgtC/SapB family protein [Lachnospiraceae bacterium]
MELLKEINLLSVTLRLLLALLCGGFLGIERGKKKRPAGFRTHMLVCVGSALAMITNQYMCAMYPNVDASRMGAQVISGIGFLGAGTIVVTGLQKIKGLTTAAGLWVVACIGLALGTGFYMGGILTTALCMLINTLLYVFENRVNANNRVLSVFVELQDVACIGRLLRYARENGIHVSEIEMGKARTDKEHIGVLLMLRTAQRTEHPQLLQILSEAEGVCYIEEIN